MLLLKLNCDGMSCRGMTRRGCLQDDEGGAELFRVELLLDFLDSELWDLDFGLSAAMAAITSIATGQNHSCSSG